jgi:hypothetical protein
LGIFLFAIALSLLTFQEPKDGVVDQSRDAQPCRR